MAQKQRIFKRYALCLSLGVLIFVGVLLCTLDMASFITLFAALLTIYVAAYAIAWAKYEFHVSRQSQQMSVLAALCATDKRKSFAPALAEITNKKLPKHPTLFTPRLIWASLCALPGDKDYLTEDNRDTIDMVAKILLGFDDWEGANLCGINLKDTLLGEVNFNGADLNSADLRNAYLGKADISEANLRWAMLSCSNLYEAYIIDANLGSANLSNAYLCHARLTGADLSSADLHEADLSCADLRNACLHGADLNSASLHCAKLNGAILDEANLNGADLSGCNLCGIMPFRVICDSANPFPDLMNGTLIRKNDIESNYTYFFVKLLETAKNLQWAELPAEVEKILRREHPHLFDEPTPNTTE